MQLSYSCYRYIRGGALCLIVALLSTASHAMAATASHAQVADRYQAVRQMQQRVAATGRDTTYESTALHTVSLFLDFAKRDAEDLARIERLLGKYERILPQSIPAYAAALPGIQLADCMTLLDRTEASLRQLMSGELNRRTPPVRDGRRMQLDGDYVTMDGRPVFPSTMIWMPHTPENEAAFGAFLTPYSTLEYMNEDLTGNRPGGSYVTRHEAKPNDTRFRSGYFIGHGRPKWMEERFPEMIEGERFFTRYDIDNPTVRGLVSLAMSRGIPESMDVNDHHIYLLANEPHFASAQGRWMASEASAFTHAGFRDWLKGTYGSVGELNDSWSRSYESFSDVHIDLPIDPALRGGAIWYDWCRYNMDRVNDWFAFLDSNAKLHDPEALTSIKMIGHQLDPPRDHGIDIEAVVRMQGMPGLDPGTVPAYEDLYVWNHRKEEVEHPYAIDWRTQTAMLDMLRSIAPDRPVYNSEWHGFGTARWICTSMSAEYVRAGLWLDFLHGDSMINAWFWGRLPDGSVRASFLNGPLTQPIALAAYGQTMHELNAFAPEVVQLAKAPKQAFVFYAEDAAISSETYAIALKDAHEALTLAGAITGFVTPTMLREDPDGYPVIVVPEASHISDESLAALRKAQAKRIFVGSGHFRLDERGNQREMSSSDAISADSTLESGKMDQLVPQLAEVLKSYHALPPVAVTDANGQGTALGVLARSVRTDEGMLVSLVNSSKQTHRVRLTTADGAGRVEAIDELGGFDGVLEPLAVRLLLVKP